MMDGRSKMLERIIREMGKRKARAVIQENSQLEESGKRKMTFSEKDDQWIDELESFSKKLKSSYTVKSRYQLAIRRKEEETKRSKGEGGSRGNIRLAKIWKARNEKQFTSKVKESMHTSRKVVEEWLEFKDAVEGRGKQIPTPSSPFNFQDRWTPSPDNAIRLNDDVAIKGQHRKAAWGIVARNSQGKLLHTWAIPNLECRKPMVEEALAVWMTLIKAREQGWDNIEVQLDCQGVIKKIIEEDTKDAAL
ncbi:hypothetical protein ACH5RR_000486 [Cinchona calisaya]|uniref:RNase H type-1 domain-containing protein n=1 Tax=Cinchona calisaya TaxID=153742 RepID=A0ABD3B0T3_9GENT